MLSDLYGNPHSASPSSERSTHRIENVRLRVLRFFKADPVHFDVVFVANATAAIKMVMIAFQDHMASTAAENSSGFWYGYHKDAHTSLVGIREFASGGSRCFASDQEVDDWIAGKANLAVPDSARFVDGGLGLFAYPAQSNMNGHRLPLHWPGRLRRSSLPEHRGIYTLLDAAAYVSTAQLDLSDVAMAPDFTALSFYKIFGFPDLGALIVRKAAGDILKRRRYFGGGTVDMVISLGSAWHAKKDEVLHEQLEDGTLPFHSIIALDSALNVHARLYGSMDRVSRHTCYLAKVLYDNLASLRHANGSTVCEIYKDPTSRYGDRKSQAPTIAFNVRNSQGGWVGKSDFEQLAIVRGIQLRTGGVCNPGGIATSLNLAPWELRQNYCEGLRCGNDFDLLGGKPTGIVRVSLGAMSSIRDIQKFLKFVDEIFVEKADTIAATQVPLMDLSPSVSQLRIDNLRIFPIEGCLGWEIPPRTAWEIKEGGLALDREWCLVHWKTEKALNLAEYPNMALLQPSLHHEEGILRIQVRGRTPDSPVSRHELTVSMWESPSANPQQPLPTSVSRKTEPYLSSEIVDFFTTIIGTPCTLARYPDYRALPADTGTLPTRRSSKALPACQRPRRNSKIIASSPIESFLPMATSTIEQYPINIIVSGPSRSSHPNQHTWRHIRIGNQYFQILDATQSFEQRTGRHSITVQTRDGTTISKKYLHHLTNIYDGSLSTQYPTIGVGDLIRTFSVYDAAEDPALGACIASTLAADFICPVRSCMKQLATKEDLAKHLPSHGEVSKAVNYVDSAIAFDEKELPMAEVVTGTKKASLAMRRVRRMFSRAKFRTDTV